MVISGVAGRVSAHLSSLILIQRSITNKATGRILTWLQEFCRLILVSLLRAQWRKQRYTTNPNQLLHLPIIWYLLSVWWLDGAGFAKGIQGQGIRIQVVDCPSLPVQRQIQNSHLASGLSMPHAVNVDRKRIITLQLLIKHSARHTTLSGIRIKQVSHRLIGVAKRYLLCESKHETWSAMSSPSTFSETAADGYEQRFWWKKPLQQLL
jgi:hypothetical protein